MTEELTSDSPCKNTLKQPYTMIEEQTKEYLHEILQSGKVNQVIIGGTQTIYNGMDSDWNRTIIPYAEIADGETVRHTKDDDALIRFIFNDNDRAKVIKGLRTCSDTGQVAVFAKIIYTEEIMSLETLRSSDFHRTIIPLLKFETTESAIKQAILKQLN